MHRLLTSAALLIGLTQATGCFMSPRTAAGLANAALITTVIAANVALVASHDAHYHSAYCGHHQRWRDGHVVYYYSSRWEYYDSSQGGWYYYVD